LNRFPDSLKSLVQTAVEIPVLVTSREMGGGLERLAGLCSRVLCHVFIRTWRGRGAAVEVFEGVSCVDFVGEIASEELCVGVCEDFDGGCGEKK